MERYNLPKDVKVFGVQVRTFPNGVGEAFAKLIKLFPSGDQRAYYGISECTSKGIIYKAAALEMYEGEAENYQYERFTVEKGDYLTMELTDWPAKTNCIKEVFEEIFNNELSDRTKPCIEIYKNETDMVCMVKIDQRKDLLTSFQAVADEFIQQLSSFSSEQINTIPFEGSWTAGQVAQHLVLSDSGFAELLNGAGKETERSPDEHVETIRAAFLNFSIKMQSPDFVRPALTDYDKDYLIATLEELKGSIMYAIKTLALLETCVTFELPVLGHLTRLEAIHFLIVHTQRHLHQLKNIYALVAKNQLEATF